MQHGETCPPKSSCDAGLTCQKCEANGNNRPRCTRVKPINPTSKVPGAPYICFYICMYLLLYVLLLCQFSIIESGLIWCQVKNLPYNRYSWLTTHNSFAITTAKSPLDSIIVGGKNQEDSITSQLKVRLKTYMLLLSRASHMLHHINYSFFF